MKRSIEFMVLALAALPAGLAQTGLISGTVVDEKGAPVPQATVSAHVRYTGPSTIQFDSYVKSGTDGKYSIDKVPAGLFEICAQLPGTDFLPTCAWAKTPQRVMLANGQRLTADVTMRRGHVLELKLNDANGHLNAREKTQGEKLLVLVAPAAYGMFPLLVKESDARSRTYSTVVPYDADLELTVRTAEFNLAGAGGAAVDARNGHKIPVRVPANAKPSAIQLNVTGVRPQ